MAHRGRRILSLLPSATEIVGGLGLEDCIVGVTHECNPDFIGGLLARGVPRVTSSAIDPHALPQGEIDGMVKASLGAGLSLYGVDEALVRAAAPDLVLTQMLCAVCAPSADDVGAACASVFPFGRGAPEILNLEPRDVAGVAETFGVVARACGAADRGAALEREFRSRLDRVAAASAAFAEAPTVLLLEWLEPPFDGGHWVPELIETAGGIPARNAEGGLSRGMAWDDVYAADPDVVLVACCGFDLARNAADARLHGEKLSKLRAAREGRLFAVDGDRYFARPSQSLAAGAALVARCARHWEPGVADLEAALGDFLPAEGAGWERLDLARAAVRADARAPSALTAAGVDDDFSADGWAAAHAVAVAEGRSWYEDPATGYRVMTSAKHAERGACCGSGCRHCPFEHANVEDRAARISQPAWLANPPPAAADPVTVLFFSGGKDSLLALRRLAAAGRDVVLLTTFDAGERRVAHQDVGIDDIVKQATHLGLPLLGCPLHRSSGRAYVDHVAAALALVGAPVRSLAFGDLHLDHIRGWREDALAHLGFDLEFPLWHADYGELAADLAASRVPCVVSAVTVDAPVVVGAAYSADVAAACAAAGLDAFGERGEFHTLARVWDVPRHTALGVHPKIACAPKFSF